MKLGIVSLVVLVVGAYVATVALYANSSTWHHPAAADNPAAGEGPMATMTVEDVQSNYSVLVANIAISPGTALLDPQTQHLNRDLTLRVRSVATPTRRTWTKGMLPGVFPVPLTIAGEIEKWPFDQYRSGPIEVELLHSGSDSVVQRVPLTFVNHLPGWQLASTDVTGLGPYRVTMDRSLSAAAFGIVILGVLVAIAGLGLFVAVQTLRDRRKFQPPMTTWYAAMLFAVVPLRNALPGSPPFGGWVDITLVLWVLVVLVVSMLLYIACWWRHLRPEVPAAPTTPAPSAPTPVPSAT
ncbi:MAG: DUF4436 domain-containing protein [Mycobacterium sp.]|uniref:DUF4436 domain-containing protein n=1 Tax=Mycobacterium sp. TaxID=1785 RepID=UPI001EB4CD51|nr:DUF4436 domain-containing protein [Mycobacterium sp.]MBV8788451.1 DUF4436 domain-containing protein [Mycobacterium sp.]